MEIKLRQLEPLPLHGACADSQIWNREVMFRSGEFTLVRAQSGKGKTTLLSVLFGLRADYRGHIVFDSVDIRTYGSTTWSTTRQRRLSIVFQDLQLFDDLTGFQNAEIKNRLTAHKTEAEINEMFDWLGLAEHRQALTARLSLGQKQRVAIIRALCQPFELLLLDEPFSHLDAENTAKAKELIQQECQRQGAGILATSLTSHNGLDCPTVLNL